MFYSDFLKNKFLLNDLQLEKFKLYYLFLKEYQKKLNLTSLFSEKDVYLKHFYDSLLISQNIFFSQGDCLCDLGTGAGFPSLPLKILYPSLKVFLIDSCLKKTIFLKKLTKNLNLSNVFIFNQRIEQHKCKYKFVITRALGALKLILKLASPLVFYQGFLIVMKGPNYKKELDEIKKTHSFNLENKFFTELPEKCGKRVNLLFKKNNF
ncbi:16S rRNA (guanine(527)-N(7))-methyltransferase RsmG [Candidatus Phytoplasma pini]|uniref:Ribosomal RNA small subunit methyltransferase G n=1 Tax=Candidatus Phytoplasma pini TaxID=267362 RepID=A0A559KJ36_9MOLU|nr:16S rRNA (guanine(527)-N(7))-methyltransferase RsmG [Candidatus Phytoplasma pini]TVY12153.1 glucose inhibited division protein B [Candidatus Phytoplasma pini]